MIVISHLKLFVVGYVEFEVFMVIIFFKKITCSHVQDIRSNMNGIFQGQSSFSNMIQI